MSDRELLELAAKAVGKTIAWRDTFDAQRQEYLTLSYGWNPRTDGDEALRLAAKLGMRIDFNYRWVVCGDITVKWSGEDYMDAIVRAAAEIGKEMK